MIYIAPSLLSCDFADLRSQIGLVEAGGADYLHLDVMDGHFVPNISFGAVIVEAASKITKLVSDVHLMISEPDKYIESFAKAGADICTVHVEVLDDPRATLSRIRSLGMAAGISINPDTNVERVLPYLGEVSQVLVMSVFPGFSGQKFIPEVLSKVSVLVQERGSLDFKIEIDGGVNLNTVSMAVKAGADVLVAATAIFKQPDIPQACRDLRQLASDAKKELLYG